MSEQDERLDRLRGFLAEQDEPCPGCGYNLRGLRTDVCPECRKSLVLRVGLVEQKLGALLAALSGLLAGSGTGVVVLGILGYLTWRFGGGPTWREIGWFVVVVVLGIFVEAALAVRLSSRGGRVWFRQRSMAGRVWLAIGAWMLTAGLVALAIAVTQ